MPTNTNEVLTFDYEKLEPQVRMVARALNEMSVRVNTVTKQFQDISKIAEASKGMLYEAWDFRPVSNLARVATQWYLTPEQYNAMFGQAKIHEHAAALLEASFNDATKNLRTDQSVEAFAKSLGGIKLMLTKLIEEYINAMENAPALANGYNALPNGLKKALNKHLQENNLPTLGGMDGLAIVGTQHLGRVPLMLNALVSAATSAVEDSKTKQKIDPAPEIKKEAESIKVILDEIVNPAMREKHSTKGKQKP